MKTSAAEFLASVGGNFNSYESESVDDFELDNFSPKKRAKLLASRIETRRNTPAMGRTSQRTKTQIYSQPAAAAAEKNTNEMSKSGTLSIGQKIIFNLQAAVTNGATPVAAEFLNVPLFGASFKESVYKGLTPDDGNNPSNFEVGNSMGKPNNALSTYNALGSVAITSKGSPYPQVLEAISTIKFRVTKMRLSVSDVTTNGLLTLQGALYYFQKSPFGKNVSDSIALGTFKSPEQQQSGIIDIPLNFEIDSDSCIFLQMALINATAGAAGQIANIQFTAEVTGL